MTAQKGDGVSEDELLVEQQGAVLTVTFNRPAQHNAMTFSMYEGLYAACERADGDDGVRVLVLRGAGGKAFVAGTDISQFSSFSSGQDGIDYEERITRVTDRLESVTVPTVALVTGHCIGGGLILAAACDLRIATRDSRFGAPVARTLGNCLSMNTISLLTQHLGPSRALDMILRARLLRAEDAATAGFVTQLCDEEAGDEVLAETVQTLLKHAPLTMWAAKESVRRLRRSALPDGDDIVSKVFGSDDFHHGVESFLQKEKPKWTGR